jgi:alpha-galactosidase
MIQSRRYSLCPAALLLLALAPLPLAAVTPTAAEKEVCRRWVDQHFSDTRKPFSYRYDAQPNGTAAELAVRPEVQRFDDFPAVEWVVRFENRGTAPTRILEAIQALDASFDLPAAKTATLHWARGGVASFDDFKPELATLESGRRAFHLDSIDGRSSGAIMPYFNLQAGGRGVIVAIGWSGTWAADFRWDSAKGAAIQAGMIRTHLKLLPGESIRTPRMAVLFYEGDRWRGQNLWRQFVLRHHRPQPNGKPLVAPVTNGNWGGTAASIHLDNIRKIVEHKLPVDYYWIDAEWHGGAGSWSSNAGNWEVKRDVYPQGFKPLSEALRKSGRELMLWFEPERVYRDTPWYREHAAWLLTNGTSKSKLMNLGIPAARRFITDYISDRITEYGLGCYRQDFNTDPRPYWTAADQPDREGIAEIHYIEGLYAFWDELLARHPGLIIDNCASGGRRLDFETLGRATAYWRSDGPRDAIAHQAHTWGLLPWVPLNATSVDQAGDDYNFRSGMSSALCLNWWVSEDKPAEIIPPSFPFAWARKTLDQYVSYRKYYYGDYYPLTAYNQAPDTWMAYQLDRPDLGEGLLVVLKRPESPYPAAQLKLRELDPAASYRVESLDTGAKSVHTGRELSERGLNVTLPKLPDTALFRYTKTK